VLQSTAGLLSLLCGHTNDLPILIAGGWDRVRSALAIEFVEMNR
jgi:hypothetical protein